MRNNKGFSLIECLAVLAIIGILAPLMGRMMINAAKIMKMTTRVPVAQTLIARIIPIGSSCTQIDGTYYGRATDSNTLGIYTNSTCSASFGTLNRLDNASWFNELTFTDWLVYSSSGLKVRLVKYTKGN